MIRPASRAPKGVLCHYFPGGKAELAVAAINAVMDYLCADLDKLFGARCRPCGGAGRVDVVSAESVAKKWV